jgi:hypothetical protein
MLRHGLQRVGQRLFALRLLLLREKGRGQRHRQLGLGRRVGQPRAAELTGELGMLAEALHCAGQHRHHLGGVVAQVGRLAQLEHGRLGITLLEQGLAEQVARLGVLAVLLQHRLELDHRGAVVALGLEFACLGQQFGFGGASAAGGDEQGSGQGGGGERTGHGGGGVKACARAAERRAVGS